MIFGFQVWLVLRLYYLGPFELTIGKFNGLSILNGPVQIAICLFSGFRDSWGANFKILRGQIVKVIWLQM